MKDIKSNNIPNMSIGKLVAELANSYSAVIKSNLAVKVLPSVMLWGPPGVGKSQAVREIAKQIEIYLLFPKQKLFQIRKLMFNLTMGLPRKNVLMICLIRG